MGRDKKLDDILRERLGKLDAAYQEADWEKVQHLLPKSQRSSFEAFHRRGLVALALLGMFGAGYWLGSNQPEASKVSATLATSAAEQTSVFVQTPLASAPQVRTEARVKPAQRAAAQFRQAPLHQSSPATTAALSSVMDTLNDYALSSSEWSNMDGKDVQLLRTEHPSPAQFLNLPLDQLVWLAFNPMHHTQTEIPSANGFLHGNQLGILAGAGLFQSFASYSGFNAVLNPSIGLMFMHWKGRLGVSLGAIYTPRSGVNTQYAYTQTTYNLEAKVDTGFVNTRQLHMLDVPVLVHYQIHPKHFVSFGPSISWMVNTTSTTQLVGEQAKTGMLGYHGGFRQLDWGLEGGWGMQVNRALGLNVTAHIGMRDLTRNEVYHSSGFDRNVGLRVMLRYKLFANR